MAIADGADRARVLDAIAEIAAALEAGPRAYSLSPGHDLALADGEAGIALFLSELPAYQEAAARRIDRAIHGLEARGLDASLHFGFTGIAWAWQRVMTRLGETCDDSLAVADDAVLELLGSSRGRRLPPGVLFGLAGLAIYALDRATPVADRCLAEIVELLHASAQPHGDGLRWWLAPPAGTAYVERFPDGFYDLGLDVGAAGIAIAAAGVAARGVARDRARSLAAGATRWIRAQHSAAGLPSKLGVDGSSVAAFGWCKGELGIALALLATGEPGDREAALTIGHRAARVDPGRCDEPGIHLGAAGALHAFNRLYTATGRPAFRDAARRWLDRLLALRRPGGIAGFRLATGEPRQGLVQGAAGIGLALLSAVHPERSAWDHAIGGPHGPSSASHATPHS